MHEVFVSSIVGGGEFTMQRTNSYHRQNVKKKAAGLPLESDEFRSVDGPSPFRSVSD